ncbi:rubredoxin [bacterium]|nr:rubredoxin [bacterium]
MSKWLCKNCDYEKRGGPKLKKCPQCKSIDSHYLAPTWEDP